MRRVILFLIAFTLAPAAWAHFTVPLSGGTLTVDYFGNPGSILVFHDGPYDNCIVTAEAVEVVVGTPLLSIQSAAKQPAWDVSLSVTPVRHPANKSETTAVELSWRATGYNLAGAADPGCTGSGIVLFNVTVIETEPAPPPVRTAANQPNSGTSGDPVNTYTGELIMQEPADLLLGGPMPLMFNRYYASGIKRDALVQSALGNNWMHNFDLRYVRNGSNMDIVFAQGQKLEFQLMGVTWQLMNSLAVPFQLVQESTGFVLADPQDGRRYRFDTGGKLTAISDRNNNTHTLTYTGGALTAVSDGAGRTLTLTYNGSQNLAAVSDGSRSVAFTYIDTGQGNALAQATDALGRITKYTYDNSQAGGTLLTERQSPALNVPYKQTYDASGRVISQSDGSGNIYTYGYGAGVTTITDPLGKTRIHQHDASGRLIALTDESSRTTTFGYDGAGRRTTITDRLADTTSTTYHPASGKIASVTDAAGNVTQYSYLAQVLGVIPFYDLSSITYADGTSMQFTYDVTGHPLTITDQANNVWTYTYDSRGLMLTAKNPLGGLNTFTYNADGTTASAQDHFSNKVLFGYDAYRRLAQIRQPDGAVRSFTFDAGNQLLTDTDENGATTSYAYTANGNVQSITDPLLKITSYTYDANDRLLTIADRLGKVASLSYDQLGQLSQMSNAASEIYGISYDPQGRVKAVADAAGKAPSHNFDAEGALAAYTDPRNKVWSYATNKLGMVRQETTPLGAVRDYTYDALGRLVRFRDALAHEHQFTYDLRGQLTSTTQPGGARTVLVRNALGSITRITDANGQHWDSAFDAEGRLTSQTDPLGRVTSYAYDTRRKPSTVTLPNGSLTLSYDPAGNMLRKLYSDGTDLSYAYDANNRLATANNLSFGYDAEGQITNSNGLGIARDHVGRIASVTYATDKLVSYAYNSRGLISQVSDWLGGITSLTYDDAGNVQTISRPNGVVTTYAYDDDSRVIGINESKSSTLASIVLSRDGEGQIAQATRNTPASPALTETQQVYSYDAASQVAAHTYDALGRVTADGKRSYVWDLASRLASFAQGGVTTSFTYDALNNRVSRTANGVTQSYAVNYALTFPSVSIVKQGAADLRYYVYLPSGYLLHSIDAANNLRRYYHFDETGSTTFLTDDAGAITDTYGLTPFGETLSRTGTGDNPFIFRGAFGTMDEGNGLYYMRARYYDSASGRFISPDPLKSVAPESVNPYQYATNNPLSYDDPTGQAADLFTPTSPGMVAKGLTWGLKKTFEAAARSSANDAISIYQAGLRSTPQLSNAVSAANTAQAIGKIGKVAGVAINVYKEGAQAQREGKGALGIAARGVVAGAAGYALGAASAPVALADGLTGGNFKQSMIQVYRVPEALLGNSRAGRAYEKAAAAGDYGFVVQKANRAGEMYAEQGFFNTIGKFFEGDFITETADGLGQALFGPMPEPYVYVSRTTRVKPYMSQRESANKP